MRRISNGTTCFAIVAVAFGCCVDFASGQVTINANRDSGYFAAGFVDGVPQVANLNMGAHIFVPVGLANNADRLNRSLFDFDVASNVPSGSTVNSVTFEFTVSQQGGPQGMASVDFSLHRVTQTWDEGTGIGDTGTPSGDGATWDNATAVIVWATPGGDFDAATSGTVLVNGADLYSISSAKLVSDVQNIVDGTASNFGFLLKADPETVPGSAARVTSREAATGDEAKLIIDFTPGGVLLGDVNLDGSVNLLDVDPFVDRISTGTYQAEADINEDLIVNLLDVDPFVTLLSGS